MSSIQRAPISYFVYSALSCFGSLAPDGFPGRWFVRVLTDAGRNEAAVRQTLYRMEADGELRSRKSGRTKFYWPSAYARAEMEAGTEKIFRGDRDPWDGRWTIIRVGLRTPRLKKHRERTIALLAVEGYARVDADGFVHPRADPERVINALAPVARKQVLALRGEVCGEEGRAALLRLWPVPRLAARYGRVMARLNAMQRVVDGGIADELAFLLRFAVVFEYLGVAWDDPGLPRDLLPVDWPGERARVLAAQLYERLLPQATRHAVELLHEIAGESASMRGV